MHACVHTYPYLTALLSPPPHQHTPKHNKQFPALLIDKAPGQLLKGLITNPDTTNNNNDVTVALFQRAAAPWAFASDR